MNGAGRLEISTAIDRSDLLVRISDNGVGISPQDLANLFKPFFTTKASGTGLGLAVVQGIMKEHRGRVEVTSQVGQGTIMKLYLPIAA